MLTVIELAIKDYAHLGSRDDDWASASMFLFSRSREWKEHRQLVCNIAGVDPGYVARKAREMRAAVIIAKMLARINDVR